MSPDARRTILIAGCGYVGTALGLRLAAAGDEVWGLRRDTSRLPAALHPLQADLANASETARLAVEVDAAVFSASPASSSEHAYRAVYDDALDNFIAALKRSKRAPGRFVLVSSTRVYGQSDGGWVDENSPARAQGFRAEALLDGEARVRSSGLPFVIVRFGGIYGPGRPGALERALAGLPVTAGGQPLYGNRIHRDDCAGILQHVLNLRNPSDLYLGVDSDPCPRDTVRAWLAERCGHDVPAPDAVEPLRDNKRCSNKRILESGYAFAYPTFREGFDALLKGGAFGGW